MLFLNLCISLIGLSTSVAAFTISSPSSSAYWVQFATNTISWSNGANDSSLVSLQVINSNATLLNGVFSIAEYVPASLQSYTVTNVTLVVADGYMVQMVNPLNATQVYATSPAFSVKPNGTALAPGTTPDSASGMNGNMTGMNMTGMRTVNGSNSHNSTSGFNSNNNTTASKDGAKSTASSVVSASLALLLAVASAIGLAIV